MERSKASQKLHFDPAETRSRRLVPASQMLPQSPLSTSKSSANSTLVEFAVPYGGDKQPALNYSFQTGEEFAFEFMRDKAVSRKHFVPNNSESQTIATGSVDQRRMHGISTAGVPSDHDHLRARSAASMQSKETVQKVLIETKDKDYYQLTKIASNLSDYSQGFRSSGASSDYSTKMKFLCSYGGSILPRPGDGKLRYVGGDTRILSISKHIAWLELKQKTATMYKQPHIIKYQLPGEDLDALVSLLCDDDLEQMFEECSVLEANDGSKKPRMFLLPSDNNDGMHFSLGSMEGDSESRYISAINDFEGSGGASSSYGLASTSASGLDQLLIFNVEVDGAKASTVVSAIVETGVAPQAASSTVPLPAKLFSPLNNHPTYQEKHKRHSADGSHNAVHHHDSFRSEEKGIPIASVPSHLHSIAYSAPTREISSLTFAHNQLSLHRGAAESLSSGIQSKDQKAGIKEVKSSAKDLSWRITENKELSSKHSLLIKKDGLSPANMHSEAPFGTSAPERVPRQWLKHLENPKEGSQLQDVARAGKSLFLSPKHGHLPTPVEVFTSGMSALEDTTGYGAQIPNSTPSRASHMVMLPWEQGEAQVHLSKSDEAIDFQQQVLNHHSGVKQELPAKLKDHLRKENQSSNFHNLFIPQKPPSSDSETARKDARPNTRYKELADTEDQMNLFGLESTLEMLGSSWFACQPLGSNESSIDHSWYDTELAAGSHAAYDKADNKRTYEVQSRVEDDDRNYICITYPLANDKKYMEERTWQESDSRRSSESSTFTAEIYMPKIQLQNAVNLPAKSTEQSSPSSGQPSSLSNKTAWQEEIVSKGNNFSNIVEDSTYAQLERNAGEYSEEKVSVPKARTIEEPRSKDHKDADLNMRMHMSESSLRDLVQKESTQNDARVMYPGHITGPSPHVNMEEHNLDQHQLGSPNLTESAEENLAVDVNEVKEPLTNIQENIREPASEYENLKPDDTETKGLVIEASHSGIELPDLQVIKNEELEELLELGSGTFGTVYHGRWKGTDVAIKRIKSSCFTSPSSKRDKLTADFWKEARILSKLHHPNVVAFYGIVVDEPRGTFAAVTEFMVNGSLKRALLHKKKYLDYNKRLLIARDAAIGMEYLHSKNIIHFDLKSDNLLVDLKDQSRPICKVGDFGLARIKRNTLVSGGMRGTLPWMAPELLSISSNKVSEKVDVYSFGIVMWEILTGEEPYGDMHYGAVIGGIMNDTLRPPVPKSCNQEWRRLMESCWATGPENRPSFSQIASRLNAMYEATQT